MRSFPSPHLFRANLAHPGGSGSPPPPPPSIPSGSRLTFIHSTSILAHTSASFPAGSRARFKRPRAASNAATLSILSEHFCSLSPLFRPVPRGLSARVRRRTRPFSAHSEHLLYSLFRSLVIRSHGSAHLLGILHSFHHTCSLLAFSGHFVICFPCSVHFPGGFRSS